MKVLGYLFPSLREDLKFSVALLLGRLVFGLTFASHGLSKLQNFDATVAAFQDPIGLGNELSVVLVIFGELVCGIALALGFLTRLAVLPMIFSMLVAFFVAHQGSFATGGELAFIYLIIFIGYLIAGPGRISVDGLIGNRLSKN